MLTYTCSIMYAVTLATFATNFHNDTPDHTTSPSTRPNDEEMQVRTSPHSTNNTNTTNSIPKSPPTNLTPGILLPLITAPLDINSLPRESEPNPQKQEYYLSPEEGMNAGIRPPTPVMRAIMAEKEKGKGKDREVESKGVSGTVIGGPAAGSERKGDITREDGKVEREV
jgi:hypothetical protein